MWTLLLPLAAVLAVAATDVPRPPRPPCVTSCTGLPDGNYQSCQGCNVFASCSGQRLVDNRPCSSNLVWDDVERDCLYTSTTCPGSRRTRPQNCVSSCRGLAEGPYQSCLGCHKFVMCGQGETFTDNMECPVNLFYDHNTRRCEWISSTCTP